MCINVFDLVTFDSWLVVNAHVYTSWYRVHNLCISRKFELMMTYSSWRRTHDFWFLIRDSWI
jgi:hypothetical protein